MIKNLKILVDKSFKLSHKNNQQILVPPNYLNGFLCLSENCAPLQVEL